MNQAILGAGVIGFVVGLAVSVVVIGRMLLTIGNHIYDMLEQFKSEGDDTSWLK